MRNQRLLSFTAIALLATACAAPASKAVMAPPTAIPTAADYASAPSAESTDSLAARSAPTSAPATPASGGAVRATSIATTDTTGSTSPAASKSAASGKDGPKPDASSPDLFILYTGDMSLRVDDGRISPTIDKIIDAAVASGGHIGSRKDNAVSVVVPSASFRQTFAAIEGLGEVTHRSIAAEDVSEEYHDAEVRLSNLKATRKRLEEFLSKAPNVNDMLTVEHELERIVMDIDRIEGRMRFLREHTAFSTLTVNLEAKAKPAPIIAVAPPPDTPPPPPRAIDLPVKWLDELGEPRLVSTK